MNDLLQLAVRLFGQVFDGLISLKGIITEEFGAGGLIAMVLITVVTLVLLIQSLVKILFNVIRYVVLPSVALSFLASYLLQVSFSFTLPASVSLFVIILLFKN